MHLPHSEILLVYKILKNSTPRRQIATSLFSLKPRVYGQNIIVPYGPHKKSICYPTNNNKICGEHTPLQVLPF